MSEKLYVKPLANGLTLLGQQMENVSSTALTLVLPAGAAYDPPAQVGAGAVAIEWCARGAGDRDTRQLNDALDELGCEHQENVLSEHLHFSAVQLGQSLPNVLAIVADMVQRPRLEDATFEPCRELTLQDLASLEDEPAHKCNMLLRENFFPHPLGRCVLGTDESLRGLTAQAVRKHITSRLSPHEAILAVAGDIDWNRLCDQAESLFGSWKAAPPPTIQLQPPRNGVTHIAKESAQAHIALACPSVPMSGDLYYAARMAETVLSGGMSSRLFTEVREKRGLVYSVFTRYTSLRNYAGLLTYAGTRPDLAQQTFDVTVGELRRLAEGIEPEEVSRARIQLKSSLVMQGESTAARAESMVSDWHHLRRLRTLSEVSAAIDGTTADDILNYLRQYPADNFTVLVIGPAPIDAAPLRK